MHAGKSGKTGETGRQELTKAPQNMTRPQQELVMSLHSDLSATVTTFHEVGVISKIKSIQEANFEVLHVIHPYCET